MLILQKRQVGTATFMVDDVVVVNDPLTRESFSARVTACLEGGSLEVAIKDPLKSEESAWSPTSFSRKMASVSRSAVCLESENVISKVSQSTVFYSMTYHIFRIISNLFLAPLGFFFEASYSEPRLSKN